jgi:HAMP domain-containing protein
MLRNRGIRTKLLAVLAFPTVVLLIGASLVAAQGFARAGRAASVERLARDAGVIGDVVWSLHAERSQAVAVSSGSAPAKTMKPLYAATDRNLLKAWVFIGKIDIASLSPAATEAVAASARGHAGLPKLRAGLSTGSSQPQRVADAYNSIIESDIALPRRIGEALDDRSIGRSLASYSALESLIESAFQESEAGSAVIASGGRDRKRAVEFATLGRAQREAVQDFRAYATPAQISALDGVLAPRAAYTGQVAQIAASATGAPLTVQSAQWKSSSAARIAALTGQVRSLTVGTADLAAKAASDARSRALLLVAAGLLAIAVLVVLGLALARTITRPLRRLTASAAQVAQDLPGMVERMALPGEEVGVNLPKIDVRSTDEVGQLARAFKNVNDTTVRVAQEQAALRGSIAEMFVNVARRNHVLLSRQLSFIDQLERTEENPDTLEELFRLDHLATRMRRNAESLIVLAGVDAGRRLRRPMPLSDVVRTAVSEIERYDRVDLELQADPAMVGHVALMAAHLIAELLENATQFSNPDTRVSAATAFGPAGVRVTLSDQGLGMTWEEINDANHRIANPPAADFVGSQRLGFYVVGRLARRLDASVVLAPGQTQGTVVTIDLPPALFVPGSVAELPSEQLAAGDSPAASPGQGARGVSADEARPGGVLPGGVLPGGVLPGGGSGGPFAPSQTAPDGGLGQPVVQPRVPVQAAPIGADAEFAGPALDAAFAAPALDAGSVNVEPSPGPGTPGPSGGIFSGFWSRRSDTSMPAPTPEPPSKPVPAPEPAGPPASLGPDPVEERGYRPSHAQPMPTADEPIGEPASPAADLSPLDPAWSAFDSPTEPAVPSARATPPAVAQPPMVVPPVVVEPPAVVESLAGPVSPEPIGAMIEPQPARTPQPARAPQPARTPEPEPRPEPEPQPAFVERRVAQQPVADPESLPAAHPIGAGVPSTDVLPARSLGRGLFRRSGKSKPVRPVVRQAQPKQPHHNRRAIDAIPGPVSAPAFESPPAATPAAFAPTDPAPAFAPAAESVPAGSEPSELFGSPPVVAGTESAQAQSAALPVPASPFAPPSSPPLPVPAGPAPTTSVPTTLRERSAMASRALSELSAASTYSPQAVEKPAPQSLQRRTPLATPAGKVSEPPDESLRGRRGTRNATDVRTMLSGYQAGVERGRTVKPGEALISDQPTDES